MKIHCSERTVASLKGREDPNSLTYTKAPRKGIQEPDETQTLRAGLRRSGERKLTLMSFYC